MHRRVLSPSLHHRKTSLPLVVTSEDHSHGGRLADSAFREGRQSENDQQSAKKDHENYIIKIQKSELQSRPEQLSTVNTPKINLQLRRANRKLETEKLLSLLRSETPSFFDLAEVVGKWVGIQFSDKQPPTVTRVLAELGFHWNNTRQAWQHTCGTIVEEPANYDPRKRYGSFFAATVFR